MHSLIYYVIASCEAVSVRNRHNLPSEEGGRRLSDEESEDERGDPRGVHQAEGSGNGAGGTRETCRAAPRGAVCRGRRDRNV